MATKHDYTADNPPADVFKMEYDGNYLVDVVGIFRAHGTEKEIIKDGIKSKLNIIELDNNGYRFKCTLFGEYVDELNYFLSSGDKNNAAVAIMFAKVKMYLGKPVLQNAINATKILINHDSPQIVDLRKRMAATYDSPTGGIFQLQDSSKLDLVNEFLAMTPRSTIEALKECSQESCFVVLGIINMVLDNDSWWYLACVCNRKVYPRRGNMGELI